MKINGRRVWKRIEELGRIGATEEGGVSRLAFSQEDRQATELVIEWMQAAGLQVRRDAAGNVFGRRPGEEAGPLVMVGSHLDSVASGGRFDGVLGVILALECLQVLEENGCKTRLPIEMAVFAGEEGSRFPGCLLGSMAVTGLLPPDYPYQVRDAQGILLADALRQAGLEPERFGEAKRRGEDIKVFLEAHIEQAPVLEQAGKPVGIVSAIAGPHQYHVTIRGRSGHAGATPMQGRADPMVAAAQVIQKVEELALTSKAGTRGTVGFLQAFPGGHNVIPAQVDFTIDWRGISEDERDAIAQETLDYLAQICKERGLTWTAEVTAHTAPVQIQPQVLEVLQTTAQRLGLDYHVLPSWAAHDAMIMSQICPVGMIFVRSQGGLSHCPEEFSTLEDIILGGDLLLNALLTMSRDLSL